MSHKGTGYLKNEINAKGREGVQQNRKEKKKSYITL